MAGIDLNRGARMQTHPAGHFVCMYEDDPGIYYTEDGRVASDGVAREAGFDVEHFAKVRERNRLVAEAKAKIEREFAETVDHIERTGGQIPAPDPEPEPNGEVHSVGGWTMRKIGKRYEVLDTGGAVVETDLSKEEAEAMLEAGQAG